MPTAEAHVPTDRASRYLVQLCRHTGQMSRLRHRPPARHGGGAMPPRVQHVDWSDTDGIVQFAEGRWTLRAGSDTLTLHVEADDEDALQRLKEGIAARLEKMGRRDRLSVAWQRPRTPASPPGEVTAVASSSAPGARERRWRGTTIGLVAGGALIVAVHLGLGEPLWELGRGRAGPPTPSWRSFF
ncbi:DUF2218 domain-containing protein [Streptomyces chiangmaiensis]